MNFASSTPKPLLALLVAVAFPALAQEAKLRDVIVTAAPDERPGASLNADDVAAGRARTSDTAALLGNIPGVSLYGAGGVSSLPAIHGLADDRVHVLVDGMNLMPACPNHMNSPLSYIDPTNVASVEVFAGITPVSVGGDSLGGTVLVNSAEPEFAGAGQGTLFKGQAGTFYRSNGNANGANLDATLAGENVSLSYSGATAKSDDYTAAKDFKPAWTPTDGRSDKAGDVVESTAYKAENQSFGVALRNDNHLFELKYSVQSIPYEGFPNQRMDMTQNDSTQFNFRYKGQYQWGALEARIYDENTEHKMDFGDDKQYWYASLAACQAAGFVLGTNCAAGMPMNTEGKNTGASLKADIALSERDIVRLGGEYQRYRLNDWWPPSGKGMWPSTFWNIDDGQRDRAGVFAEWEARWNPQWLSQLGLRSDTVDMNTGTVSGYSPAYATDANRLNNGDRAKTDRNWDLTALARYTPDATQTYDAGYARKTRSPNLYERYTWSTGGMAMVMNNFVGDGNGYIGNLDLKPEVAHTLSATGDWHDAANEQWGFKATPYYTQIDNYIDARRCPTSLGGSCSAANLTNTTGFVYLQYVNQSARLYGMDISGHLPLARAGDYGSFTATGVLSYVRGKNGTTGDNLYDIMPLNARLAVAQRLGNWSNTAELQMVAAKTDVSQVRDEVRTGGYALVNLRSSYEWKQARLDVGLDNLFNRFYNPPLGGEYVGQWKTMSTAGTPYGVPMPGMGRSIYTGVNVKF